MNNTLSQLKGIPIAKGKGLQTIITLISLVALYFFFGIFGDNFFSVDTFISILNSSYYLGFIAIGLSFVIISGGIDLSVGTVTVGAGLVGGVAFNLWGWPIGASLAIVVVVGVLFGLVNGFLIGKLKLPPFIATLGTQFISLGVCSMLSRVQTMHWPNITQPGGWFKAVFFKTSGGFPTGALWLILFFVVAWILLNKTKLGRYSYAIGSNEEAVKLSGINSSNWKMGIYILAGLFSGIAGVIYAATYTAITPQTGNGLEMYAIAACVIGGASLSGGVGSLVGTIIGVFIINILKNGLMSMGLPDQWQQFFIGLVVILAVLIDVIRTERQGKVKGK